MIRRDYLIVGAGVGGGSVCQAIREHDRKGSVMMVGNESLPAYRRPALLPKMLAPAPFSPSDLQTLQWVAPAQLERDQIDVRLETLVTQINLERRLAVLSTGQAVEFRKACLAMGSRARRPAAAGASLGNVFYLRTFRDVLALREVIETETEVVVVGGGCIAAEVAAQFMQWPKLGVTLIHRGKYLWGRWFDESSAAWLTELFVSRGVKMKMGETLNGFEGRTVLKNVQTKSGQRYAAGVAVVALGVDLNLALVANTPLSYPHGTPVNDFLETDEKGIYAVGDLAAYPDRIFGGLRRMDQLEGTIAQGHTAGANMTGKKRQKFEWVPHRSVTLFGQQLDLIGDFHRPPAHVELEGARADNHFLVRYFQPSGLSAMVLCNQPASKVEALKAQFRNRSREPKKKVA